MTCDSSYIKLKDETLLMKFDTHYSIMCENGYSFDIRSGCEISALKIKAQVSETELKNRYVVTFNFDGFNTGILPCESAEELEAVAKFLDIEITDFT